MTLREGCALRGRGLTGLSLLQASGHWRLQSTEGGPPRGGQSLLYSCRIWQRPSGPAISSRPVPEPNMGPHLIPVM